MPRPPGRPRKPRRGNAQLDYELTLRRQTRDLAEQDQQDAIDGRLDRFRAAIDLVLATKDPAAYLEARRALWLTEIEHAAADCPSPSQRAAILARLTELTSIGAAARKIEHQHKHSGTVDHRLIPLPDLSHLNASQLRLIVSGELELPEASLPAIDITPTSYDHASSDQDHDQESIATQDAPEPAPARNIPWAPLPPT